MKQVQWIAAAVVAVALAPAGAGAQDVSGFYKSKTLEIYVGSDVGGGYNAYARTVGMQIGKYVPGKPDVIVKNMPGAGGRKLTGWLASIAPKDGSVIAASQPGSLVDSVLGDKFDEERFVPCMRKGCAARFSHLPVLWGGFAEKEDSDG